MFSLSDELINLVSPFLLQLLFLWPFLMDGEQGCTEVISCLMQIPPAFRVLLFRGSYGTSGGHGDISVLVFTLWGLGHFYEIFLSLVFFFFFFN